MSVCYLLRIKCKSAYQQFISEWNFCAHPQFRLKYGNLTFYTKLWSYIYNICDHSCTNVIHALLHKNGNPWTPLQCNNSFQQLHLWSQCCTTRGSLQFHGCATNSNYENSCPSIVKLWQTDVDGPIRCSSNILECEEHLINQKTINQVFTTFKTSNATK
jgi:hypothetical protein